MRTTALRSVILACLVIGHPPAAAAQVDQQRAQAYFKEALALCERDGGRLWGVSICAPMVIGDARTQTFATSQPPPDAPRPQLIGLINGPIKHPCRVTRRRSPAMGGRSRPERDGLCAKVSGRGTTKRSGNPEFSSRPARLRHHDAARTWNGLQESTA